MASIGPYTVTSWPSGRLEDAILEVAELDPWTGVNGHAFAVGAYRTKTVDCVTGVDAGTTRPQAEDLENKYRKLIATNVAVIDSVGKTWTDVFIKKVETTVEYNSATSRWRVTAVWSLRPIVVEPR